MQSAEERVGGSDHAYDKMGEEKKQEDEQGGGGWGAGGSEESEGNRVKEKCSLQLLGHTHTHTCVTCRDTHTEYKHTHRFCSINQHSFLLGG